MFLTWRFPWIYTALRCDEILVSRKMSVLPSELFANLSVVREVFLFLLYVKKELQAVKVEVLGGFPEQVWCKTCVDSGYDLLIGVCYRTPTEQVFGKDNHSKLRDMLLEVSNKNFILMGE